ncbi:MAG: methyltransferase domain-containing protein [Pseudomonadales bacterium]|nr:methyltransferase domain-containing protein [Pseudomonadales bacterium]MBO6563236.1 methyltransferase domain-containing protein [Pseudomonadales bacterium]MBO6594573.1 methyltransferase domain-containing protein [Pseudomonadales bacterium]MBO6655492.1 methyltransferase domain-containing protein [Pseudomonadales bacterium]MBO6701076.1 methyltransferase domain-containing protein [Pseudomonadales bacterium]
MDPKRTGKSYDQISDLWRGDRFDHQNGIALHEKALDFMASGGTCLNVGCGGNTRFNPILRGKDLDVIGLDISERMLVLAHESDPSMTLVHADVCAWQPERRFEFITAWDSIWHVPLSEHANVMKKLMGALSPGGVFIFSAGGLEMEGDHYDSTMGPKMYYSALGIPATLRLIEAYDCIVRHLEFDQWPEAHLAVIVQRNTD